MIAFSKIGNKEYRQDAPVHLAYSPEMTGAAVAVLLEDHKERSGSDERTANDTLHGKFLVKEYKGKYERDDHTQLVDRNDL